MNDITPKEQQWIRDVLTACNAAADADLLLWAESKHKWVPEIVPAAADLVKGLGGKAEEIFIAIAAGTVAMRPGGPEAYGYEDEVLVWRRSQVEDPRKLFSALQDLQGFTAPSQPRPETLTEAKAYSLRITVPDDERDDLPNYVHAIRKRRGFAVGKPDSMFATFASSMVAIKGPVFQFDDRYDALVIGDFVLVLNQSGFEDLLGIGHAEKQAARGNAATLMAGLANLSLPAAFLSTLGELGATRARVAKILARIKDAPWLKEVTITSVAAKALKGGLGEVVYVHNGKLKVEQGAEEEFVRLLNEDYFEGDFSGRVYRSDRKIQVGLPAPPKG
jgi:hypothetical protein